MEYSFSKFANKMNIFCSVPLQHVTTAALQKPDGKHNTFLPSENSAETSFEWPVRLVFFSLNIMSLNYCFA